MSLFNNEYKTSKELRREYKYRNRNSRKTNKTKFNEVKVISTKIIKLPSYKQRYYNFLKSDYWKKFRISILKKRNYRCDICNSGDNLQVHHISYENLYTASRNIREQDVVIICKPHHEMFHQKYGVKRIMRLQWLDYKHDQIKQFKSMQKEIEEQDNLFKYL